MEYQNMITTVDLEKALEDLKSDVVLRAELVSTARPLLMKIVTIEDDIINKEKEVYCLLRVSLNLPPSGESIFNFGMPSSEEAEGQQRGEAAPGEVECITREDIAANRAIQSLTKFAQEWDEYIHSGS
jgi:hypothetical protein